MAGRQPPVRTRRAPAAGLWRIGRNSDPLRASVLPAGGIGSGTAGNRFDSPDGSYGVIYLATRPEACFGETLIRFRPAPRLLRLVEEEWRQLGNMNIGAVPADWRAQRLAARILVDPSVRFLDIEAAATHRALERALADELDSFGYNGLDVAAVRGPDRILTRSISHWTFNQIARDGSRRFAGIRYLSRLANRWECWALFVPGSQITIAEAQPILRTNTDLLRVAHQYGLVVH